MMGVAMLKRHQFVRSLLALYRLVVSSITWGSQAQPLFQNYIYLYTGRQQQFHYGNLTKGMIPYQFIFSTAVSLHPSGCGCWCWHCCCCHGWHCGQKLTSKLIAWISRDQTSKFFWIEKNFVLDLGRGIF